jgi:hypothetical protein
MMDLSALPRGGLLQQSACLRAIFNSIALGPPRGQPACRRCKAGRISQPETLANKTD